MVKKTKNQKLTKDYFEKTLADHSQAIIEAVSHGFEENKIEHRAIFETLAQHNTRFDELEDKIDEGRNLLDGYVHAQESFKQEFKILKYRHDKAEKVLKDRLNVEIE